MKRVIYLSGPISGMPGKNHDLFMRVAQELRRAGHEVYNPREFCWTEDVFPKRKAFAAYCDFICNRADTIVLLPGWRGSKGATTEHGLAENCGLEIIEWSTLEVREKADVVDNLLAFILADDTPIGPEDAESLRSFQRATEDGKARVAKDTPFVDDAGGGP